MAGFGLHGGLVHGDDLSQALDRVVMLALFSSVQIAEFPVLLANLLDG